MTDLLDHMHDMQRQTAKRAIKMLEACRVPFTVILEGVTYGNMNAPKQYQREYKRGDLLKYVSSFVKDMQIGDVVEVPAGEYDPLRVTGSVSSYCIREWGNGSVTCKTDKKANAAIVMRIS